MKLVLFKKHHNDANHYDDGRYCQKYLVKLTNEIPSNKGNCKNEVTKNLGEVFVSLVWRHKPFQECFFALCAFIISYVKPIKRNMLTLITIVGMKIWNQFIFKH